MRGEVDQPALVWPSRQVFGAFLRFQLIFFLLFVPVYFGGKVVAEGSAGARQLFAAWELNIPYQPLMFVPYALFLFLFLLPMLHFQPRHFRALTFQTAVVLAVAALAFFLFPVQVAFPPVDMSALAPPLSYFVEFAFTRYNAVPSLHVAFTLLLLAACGQFSTATTRKVYWFIGIVVVASTVFTHQHQLIDVATGIVTALLARRMFPIRP